MSISKVLRLSGPCILLILATFATSPLTADSFLRIDGSVPPERHDFYREKIPALKDVSLDQIRYAEDRVQGISLLRIEDRRYCRNGDCLSYVVFDKSGEHLGVVAASKVWMHAISVSIGAGTGSKEKDITGSMISFETSAPHRTTIKIFIGRDFLALIP